MDPCLTHCLRDSRRSYANRASSLLPLTKFRYCSRPHQCVLARRFDLPMITRDTAAFLQLARQCPADFGAPTARAAFLVAPDGFARAEQSAGDNRYMAGAGAFDAAAAMAEHRELHRALASELPVVCFPGHPDTPDALFPNNVFAPTPGPDHRRPHAP